MYRSTVYESIFDNLISMSKIELWDLRHFTFWIWVIEFSNYYNIENLLFKQPQIKFSSKISIIIDVFTHKPLNKP